MKITLKLITGLFCFILVASCQKEQKIYEVNNEPVNQNTIDKNTLKRQSEFISQAYADLFGKPISNNALNQSLICYQSFSDKDMVEDLIIRDMLKAATGKIPDRIEIINNVDSFTIATYKKFYHRGPNELELWNIRNIIVSDTSFGPGMIYYSMMTSDEYKFY